MLTNGNDCPPALKESVRRYVEQHVRCGDFLRCVIANDLFGAIIHADRFNLAVLPEIVSFVHFNVPEYASGSELKVSEWEA
jgi:hypothetical protein